MVITSKNNPVLSEKKIIHVDMDAFYASVEQLDNPNLRGKPIAVGGSKERGVVAAASYEARAFGVRSAMPSKKAAEKCPDLIFVKPRFDRYKEVSQQVMLIFKRYTPLIEPLSLDEAFLDVTETNLHGNSAVEIAAAIRNNILTEIGLTSSAGISYCKFLAKIASDINKPNGQKLIHPVHAKSFIEKLAIEDFFGVGKATAAKFKSLNIHSGKDLKSADLAFLLKHFGKQGKFFYEIARGNDNREVKPHRIRKSIGAEKTYSNDLENATEIKSALEELITILKTRSFDKNLTGKTLVLKYRTSQFETYSKSYSRKNYYDLKSLKKSVALLSAPLLLSTEKYRLLGLSLKNLNVENREHGEQLKFDL